MELIATACFKKAMDRAIAATAYTNRITKLVRDLTHSGTEIVHPLLDEREATDHATLVVLTANRGMCAGYNGNVIRAGNERLTELKGEYESVRLEVSGKRGISNFRFRKIIPDETYTHFEDKPTYDEVDALASRYLAEYETGKLDRLDIAYTKFESLGRQTAVVETLLPLGGLDHEEDAEEDYAGAQYEFLPSAESILDDIVPMSFRVKLFKCFLDAAVSEQIARMMAMKAATENADSMIKHLSMEYNRARQGQITGELLEIIGGADALSG
jgi:F-type H+-transporting ATPase subunit gamma